MYVDENHLTYSPNSDNRSHFSANNFGTCKRRLQISVLQCLSDRRFAYHTVDTGSRSTLRVSDSVAFTAVSMLWLNNTEPHRAENPTQKKFHCHHVSPDSGRNK